MKKTSLLFVLMVITVNCIAQQPGFLDKTFGENGLSITGSLNGAIIPTASILLSDNKILVLSNRLVSEIVSNKVYKYFPDGEIDSTFSLNGFAVMKEYDAPTVLAVQKDNKIVAGGIVNGNYTILLRLKPDGTVDSTFGTNGTFTDFTFPYQHPYDVKQQADGKLVVCGYYIENVFSGIIYSLITRVNADGTLDKSFGEAGHAIEKSDFLGAYSMAIQPDGKIVCCADEPYSAKLIRYNTNGTLDSSFGTNGIVATNLSKYGDYFKDVEIQADGKIVAAGTAQDDAFNGKQPYIAVARYNTDGSLDESFGIGGKAVINYEDSYTKGTSLVVQPNGKIVVSGKTFILGTYYDICVSRLLPDGTLDSSFGFNGKMVTAIENSGEESYQVGLQTDGKIIVSSLSNEGNNIYSSILARYHGDPVATNPLITRINSWIQDNLLGWYSNNSSSVTYYSIQYSKYGSSFTEVKRVPAEKLSAPGREPSANAYRYVLATAPTDSYYRIAAIQQDGSKAYSEVVYYPGSKGTVSLYPNPVQDVLTVTGLSGNKPTTIQLVNRNGHIISAEKIYTNTFTKNIQTLQSGVYYIRILTSGNMQTLQFVKE